MDALERVLRTLIAAIAVACALTAATVHAAATANEVADLWWTTSESGWGIQLSQQHETVFATMYVYRPDGSPDFYVAVLDPASAVAWSGLVYRTSGPWFGGPFNPAAVTENVVGSMTFTLKSFYNAELAYTIDGTPARFVMLISITSVTQFLGAFNDNTFKNALVVLLTFDIRSAALLRGTYPAMMPRWHPGRLRRLAILALPLGFVMMLVSLNTNVPRYFIEHYQGTRDLGIYAAITYLMVAGTTVVAALGQSASPRLAQYFADGRTASFCGLMWKLVGIGGALGALGVLDDVTTNQASVAFQLKRAAPDLGWFDLFRHSMVVGRDHIAAVVNTLLLAYVGASLTLLLLVAAQDVPLDHMINQAFVAEEVVRTLVGSLGLVLATPITSLIAGALAQRKRDLEGAPNAMDVEVS